MAANANSLTDHDTATAPAGDFRVFVDCLERLGYRLADVIKAAGLGDAALNDPDRRVPCEAYGKLIGAALQQRFIPNLALELAQVTPIGAYPLIDYLVLSSDTVGAGLRQLARYFRLVSNPVAIEVRQEPRTDRLMRVQITPETSGLAFGVEYTAALMVLHMRRETGARFKAAYVSVQHVPDDAVAFERVLECPVHVGAVWSGLAISEECWGLSMSRRDPILRQMLERQANAILGRMPARTGVAGQVQRALAGRVAGSDVRMDTIARELALSGRTLQRRLADEGVSFQELLDDARREAAGRLLEDATLAIGEVAYLVGYSEPAPFYRAFKRWYRTTPELYRQKQHGGVEQVG